MMKKVLLVFITAASLLFYSCGSKKAEEKPAPQVPELSDIQRENDVQTDDVQQEQQIADEQEQQTESEQELQQSEEQVQEQSQEQTQQDLNQTETQSDSFENSEPVYDSYPPLEEIEEPELIEVSPEELDKKLQSQKETESETAVEPEPVVEMEELPPLSQEYVDISAESQVTQEQDNNTSIEPIIEINPEEEETSEPEPVIIPSRSVSLKKGETLSITYPGSGWIYMGSTSEYNNLASRGRKLGTTDTTYTLLAKEAGTQIHHFYKTDNLTGEYIDDYIEVTVLDKKGNSSTVVNAPDYKDTVPKKPETPLKAATVTQKESDEANPQAKSEEKPEQKPETKPSQEDEAVIVVDGDDTVIVVEDEEEGDEQEEQIIDLSALIEEAKNEIKSKKYGDAYTALTKFLEYSTDGRDEALYLMGQILESDSKFRNIKEAVNTYQTLCDSYPASEYWDKANKRIIYLKRFYINIH